MGLEDHVLDHMLDHVLYHMIIDLMITALYNASLCLYVNYQKLNNLTIKN